MKKLGIFVMSLAMAAFTFTSCNKEKGNTPIDDIVENGFYVLGEATGVADLNATGAAKLQMANGKNETEKAEREGMYEKYVILEAGKDFSFIKKEGGLNVHYTANLEEKEIATDGVAIQGGYFGLIRQAEGAMQVKASGLYHIIIDLNLDGKLDGVEGAQVILAPVEFGVRGAMNGWSYTAGVAKEENGVITWTWEKQEMAADNAEFKFAHGQCWKINLDDAEQVKAENSLGADMVAGGANITVGERGLYSISLTFKTEAGAIANSFSYKAERTGDIGIKDYSAVELELVGAAVAEQEGAVADPSSWGWGNVLSLGLPSQSGNIYTWHKAGVKLVAGEYKVRTKNFEAQGDIGAFDNGANIAVAEDVTVDITVTVDAETGKITVDDGSVAPDPVIVTVKAKMPADWANTPTAWVWPTGGDGHAEALTKQGDWWVYTTPEAVPALNIIFRNGDNWDNGQTANIENIRENSCYEISSEKDGEGHNLPTSVDCE